MTSPGMIRIGDPARIGAAVEDICAMLGLSRRDLARALAARTGRTADTWNAQLWSWGRRRSPNPASLGPVLDEIGYQLALVPVIESGPKTAPASTLAAEHPSVGALGRPEGLEIAHGASEAALGRCPKCQYPLDPCDNCGKPAGCGDSWCAECIVVPPGTEFDDLQETYPGSGVWE